MSQHFLALNKPRSLRCKHPIVIWKSIFYTTNNKSHLSPFFFRPAWDSSISWDILLLEMIYCKRWHRHQWCTAIKCYHASFFPVFTNTCWFSIYNDIVKTDTEHILVQYWMPNHITVIFCFIIIPKSKIRIITFLFLCFSCEKEWKNIMFQ